MSIDTTRLLRGIKRRITAPANQALIDNPGMLELADDVMKSFMVPLISQTRQEFFVVTDDVAVVADQKLYDIPYRYLARGLRDLKYSFDGTTTGISNLVLIAIEDEHLFAESGEPRGFYFKGDQFALVPAPINTSQYIQLWGEIPPSNLVQTSAAAYVTSIAIGATTTTITCTTVPSTMIAGVVIDFIGGKSGCRLLGMDKAITNASTTTLAFNAADVPTALAVGDWISIAQTSPVLQTPDECYPLFETKVCARILYAVGDFDGEAKLEIMAQREERDLSKMLQPRIVGEQTKIINRNGLLRRGFASWRGGGYY